MRFVVKVSIPTCHGNHLIAEGKFGLILKAVSEELKPEAVYCFEEDGVRTAIFVIDMKDSIDITSVAEPFFCALNAKVTFHPAFTPAELGARDAQITATAKKWLEKGSTRDVAHPHRSPAEALIHTVYEHFSKGDIPALLALIAPNAPWNTHADPTNMPAAGLRKGPEGAAEFFKKLSTEMTTQHFQPKEFFSAGNHVTVLGEYKYRHNAQGKNYAGTFTHLFVVEHGKIQRWEQWVDYRPVV